MNPEEFVGDGNFASHAASCLGFAEVPALRVETVRALAGKLTWLQAAHSWGVARAGPFSSGSLRQLSFKVIPPSITSCTPVM
jgi:hypothetical protein